MRRITAKIALAVLLVCCTSCLSAYKAISVTGVTLDSATPHGMKSLDANVLVGVNNPAGGVKLTKMTGAVKLDGQKILDIYAGDVKLDRKSERKYLVPLTGRLDDTASLIQLFPLLKNSNFSRYTVDFSARATLPIGLGKTLAVKDVPLDQLTAEKK